MSYVQGLGVLHALRLLLRVVMRMCWKFNHFPDEPFASVLSFFLEQMAFIDFQTKRHESRKDFSTALLNSWKHEEHANKHFLVCRDMACCLLQELII